MKTHTERLAELREAVDRECGQRWERMVGATWHERDRIEYAVGAGYARSRQIETRAKDCWRNLERAVRECETFLSSHDAEAGAFTAAALSTVIPGIRQAMDHDRHHAVTSGEAAFSDKPPSRRTFIRDRLFVLAQGLGLSDPFELPITTLAVFTLLSRAFWPYTPSAEKRFEKNGYPTAAEVIRKEAENIRKLTDI